MNNESFYMHPRYDEFTTFLKTLNTDAKITPSTKHLAFDVWSKAMTELCGERWLETGNQFVEGDDMSESQIEWYKAENARLAKENQQLMKDVHRIDTARQSAVNQSRALAEEVNRLTGENMALMAALSEVSE